MPRAGSARSACSTGVTRCWQCAYGTRVEVELPDMGPVWVEDAETGEQLYVDTHDPKFRAQFAEEVRRREADLNATFLHAGVEPWSLSTAEDLVRAIVRFASVRKQVHGRRREPVSRTMPRVPRKDGGEIDDISLAIHAAGFTDRPAGRLGCTCRSAASAVRWQLILAACSRPGARRLVFAAIFQRRCFSSAW